MPPYAISIIFFWFKANDWMWPVLFKVKRTKGGQTTGDSSNIDQVRDSDVFSIQDSMGECSSQDGRP